MRKFNFSRPARKKPQEPQPPPPPIMPMSKAHKILGSTPLSIDASSIHSTPQPNINVASVYDNPTLDELDFDLSGGQTRMARADAELRKERGPSPSNLRLSALADSVGFGAMALPGTLKKAQSSSTIKSWHDKSKHSRSLSRQASIPIMNNGLSAKTHHFQDTDNANESTKLRKKPPKLEFSSVGPTPRLSKKASDTFNPNLSNSSAKTPTLSSPFSAPPHRQSDLRGMFKRRTKDSFRSFAAERSPPGTGEARRMTTQLSDNGLSTLYDHYEQMTFRHGLDDDDDLTNNTAHKTDPTGGRTEGEWREVPPRQNLDWLHKPISESHEAKAVAQSDYSSSPGDGARSVSSRHTRTSRASRITDSGMPEADFQEKSVLLLSSDSEEDDDGRSSTRLDHIPLPHPTRPLPEIPIKSRPRQSSGREPGVATNKKTSFSPANTYIAIPGTERKQRQSPSPSRLSLPHRDGARAPSPKPSVGSTNSTGSGLTSQNGYGTEDSPPVTVLPARRPSQAEMDRQKALALLTSGTGSFLQRESLATSSDQPDEPTPPLSPSSANFYLRSARSSIDDSGSQGRVMTLTRQEEMLISALRKKTQAMREKSQLGPSNRPPLEGRQGRRHVSTPSQVMVTDSMLDFDFPAPPSHSSKHRQSGASSLMSASIPEHPYSEDEQYRAPSRLTTDTSSERASFVSSTRGPEEYPEQHDIRVYLDQGKQPNAQWNQLGGDGQALEDSTSSSGFHAMSWDHPEDKRTSRLKNKATRQLPQAESITSSPKLTRLSEDGDEDVPRPDSPISNETFSQPRPPRRAAMNTARLSAVGFVRRDTEPGWWGDDD